MWTALETAAWASAGILNRGICRRFANRRPVCRLRFCREAAFSQKVRIVKTKRKISRKNIIWEYLEGMGGLRRRMPAGGRKEAAPGAGAGRICMEAGPSGWVSVMLAKQGKLFFEELSGGTIT